MVDLRQEITHESTTNTICQVQVIGGACNTHHQGKNVDKNNLVNGRDI